MLLGNGEWNKPQSIVKISNQAVTIHLLDENARDYVWYLRSHRTKSSNQHSSKRDRSHVYGSVLRKQQTLDDRGNEYNAAHKTYKRECASARAKDAQGWSEIFPPVHLTEVIHKLQRLPDKTERVLQLARS